MQLPEDDPARAKYSEMREAGKSREEIVAAMDTYEVACSFLIKGLSPGHAKAVISELAQHMVEIHFDTGLGAVSAIGEPVSQDWLKGPLTGDLDG